MIYTVGKEKKGEEYTTWMDDENLNKRPEYLRSMAGNPQNSRLGRGIDVKTNLFKIVQVIEKDMSVVDGSGTLTIEHNLGYRPFVSGSYLIKEGTTGIGVAYPVGLRGYVPENRVAEYGGATLHNTYVNESNNKYFTVVANLTAFDGKLKFKLELLRETMI